MLARAWTLAASIAVVEAKKGYSAIEEVKDQLEKFQSDLDESIKEAQDTFQEQQQAFGDEIGELGQSLKELGESRDTEEGKFFHAKAEWEEKNAKCPNFSVFNERTCSCLQLEKKTQQGYLDTETKYFKAFESRILKQINDAVQALELIEKARNALAAAATKAQAEQALLQIQGDAASGTMFTKAMAALVQAPADKYESNNSQVMQLLGDLANQVQTEKADYTNALKHKSDNFQEVKTHLSNDIMELGEKIAECQETLKQEREDMQKAKQELHKFKGEHKLTGDKLHKTQKMADNVLAEAQENIMNMKAEHGTISKALQMVNTMFPSAPAEQVQPIEVSKSQASCEDQFGGAFIQKSVGVSFLRNKSFVSVVEEDGSEDAAALLVGKSKQLHSVVLAEVAHSLSRRDPLKKVRIMISNLIAKLKADEKNDLKRHQFCTTEETKIQTERTKQKKEIRHEAGQLQKAQAAVMDNKLQINNLNQRQQDMLMNCNQLLRDSNDSRLQHQLEKQKAEVGAKSIAAVITHMKEDFYGDQAQAQMDEREFDIGHGRGESTTVKASYTGEEGRAKSIMGLMESLQKSFEKTVDISAEEESKLNGVISDLQSDYARDHQALEDEKQIEVDELEKAESEKKAAGESLSNFIDGYASQTQLLIEHNRSSACGPQQLSKEEQEQNKAQEIQALKDALEILNNHGK